MLILSRKAGEKVVIGNVTITVLSCDGRRVRVGIDAPPEARILRSELLGQQRSPPPALVRGRVP